MHDKQKRQMERKEHIQRLEAEVLGIHKQPQEKRNLHKLKEENETKDKTIQELQRQVDQLTDETKQLKELLPRGFFQKEEDRDICFKGSRPWFLGIGLVMLIIMSIVMSFSTNPREYSSLHIGWMFVMCVFFGLGRLMG